MGVSLSWLAVRGKTPKAIRGELCLRSTGTPVEAIGSAFAGAASEAGWYLIVARGWGHRIIRPPVMERLSLGCESITCTVEEHVMWSEARGWRDGGQLWSVCHRGEDGPKGIYESGALPPEYASIRDEYSVKQEIQGGAEAGVDFLFEVPVVLAQTFAGYKHDEHSPEFENSGFERLECTRTFFQRLFAR